MLVPYAEEIRSSRARVK